MKNVTFVLMTCGELTEAECLAAVAPFRDEVEFAEVRNVYPQARALNEMIRAVRTEYFVPLDADMVLDHDAWPRVQNAINRNQYDGRWHSVLFNLWDTLTERTILALKVMRSEVARACPFAESATPDVEHYRRLTDLGYTCVHDYLKQRPIGKHVVRGRHFCYHKYRDVYQTLRSHGFQWDAGAFMGPGDLAACAKAHFDFFFAKWVRTDDPDCLHCIAGMMDGILSPPEHRSKNLAPTGDYLFTAEEAAGAFLDWHLRLCSAEWSGSMVF